MVSPGGSAALGIGLTVSGTAPAALQWTLGYSAAQLSAVSITTGSASSAAGKTLSCVSAAGAATCLVAGLNATPIGSGNVAFLNATLAPGVTAATIQITKTVGVDPNGNGLSFGSVAGGTIGARSLLPFTCSPASLNAGGKSTCTVSLSQAAPSGGSAIGLVSNNSLLTVPASATIPAGATAATFTATAAGTIASSQSAVITATFGGSSQTAALTLAPAISLSALTCNPTSLASGAAAVCTATLSGAAPSGGLPVNLASNSALLTVPASVTVPAGVALATFNATARAVTSNQSVIVTATTGAVSRTATLSLTPAILLSKLTCTPFVLGPAATATCTVALKSAATGNGTAVALQSNNASLTVPSSATVPGGASTVSFSAKAAFFRTSQTAILTASLNGSSATASLSLSTKATGTSGAQVSSLSCSSESLRPGSAMTCELLVTGASRAVSVALASSSDQVQVPAVVTTRPNQSSLTFQAESSPVSMQQTVTLTARLGGAEAETTVRSLAASAPVLQAPAKQVGQAGMPMAFQVKAADVSDLPVQIQATSLPDGASFDPRTGIFEWKPGTPQTGKHQLQFTATNSARQSSTVQTEIDVDGGLPVVNASAAVCSPGAVASLNGKWLAAAGSHFFDPSGASFSLGGTSVTIDGQPAPVLYSSADRVDFLCPDGGAGTALSVQVASGFGASLPVKTVMQTALPTLLTLEGRNQGLISFEGMSDLAMERNFRVPSHPAQPGDQIVIHATGMGAAANSPRGALMVKLGDVYAGVDSVEPVSGYAGVYGIHLRVPAAITFGTVPVQLQLTMPGGFQVESNSATAFFEAVRQ
ncbi:MAG: putative Ig domain-containing protein [Acidobacteriota bacterium]